MANSDFLYRTIGASNHVPEERQKDDYYATDPEAMVALLKYETFSKNVWEPAVGGGHLAEVLKKFGHEVIASDIVDRGYPGTKVMDFLKIEEVHGCDIITNPPYNRAAEFITHALDISDPGTKIAMFLKVTFLEGQKRAKMFRENPPKTIYVFPYRVKCAKNGDFENVGSSAIAYAWFVWVKGFQGDPVVKWI